MNNCIFCNNETKNLKFCSKSCAAKFNNQGIIRNKPKNRICIKCKEIFVNNKNYRSKFCPKCKNSFNYKLITIKEYHLKDSIKNKHPSWKNAHIRLLNRQWNKNKCLLPCANCGYDKHVELCHIKAISSFNDSDILGDINHPDNVIQLCPNCHWEFDNKLLLIEQIIEPR